MTVPLSPAELRAEFERLILTDLLGPSKPDEVLPGLRTPVREWYLVGMLAPKGTVVDPNRGDDDDLPGDDEGGAPGPDGQPAKVVLFPSSVGFTAAVDASCTSLTVTASWGRYEKTANPDPTVAGAYQRLWLRHPAGGLLVLPLAEGDVGPLVPDPAEPEVVVRGRCRRTASCWLVTLFLVNEQMPVRQNVDARWLFQVELAAAAPDGTPVFVYRQAGGRVVKQEVATGAMNDDEVTIERGLKAGDRVLLSPPANHDRLALEQLPATGASGAPARTDTGKQGSHRD